MIYQLTVPGPIEDVVEVRVLEWHAIPGRTVAPGDLMVELETHKALVEVRAAQAGVLRKILCPAGSWQEIGKPLALLGDDENEELPSSPEAVASLRVHFDIT